MPHHLHPWPQSYHSAHNFFAPNPLHLHILAVKHLTWWLTPFGVFHMNSLSDFFPPHLITMCCCLLSKSVVPVTLSNYATGLFRFSQFCDDYNIPKAFCMPASEALVTMYITCHGTASISASTMQHWLLGLELCHEIHSAPWLGHSNLK